MSRTKAKRAKTLAERFPPSRPCSCKICLSYCKRPGWWTVVEASHAIEAGLGRRMMLEMSPDRAFGVLSPSFKGCEVDFALDLYSDRGCNFLEDDRCELYGTGFQPLECRYCHHDRPGLGQHCHAAIEEDWNTSAGRSWSSAGAS